MGHEVGRLALVMLFVALPFILGGIGVRQIHQERQEFQKARLERNLQDALASYERYGNTDLVVERLLLLLERRAFSGPGAVERLRRLIPRFHRLMPGVFSFTVLDGDGRQVADLCEGSNPKTVLRRLFQGAVADQAGDPSSWIRDEALFRGITGPLTPLARFSPSRLLPAVTVNHNRFVFMTRAYPEGMVIVRVSQRKDWSGLGYRLHHARQKYSSTLRIALINRHEGSKKAFLGWKIPARELSSMAKRLRADLQRKTWLGRDLWAGKVLSARWTLVGRIRLPGERVLQDRLRQMFGAGVVFWLLASIWLWHSTRPASGRALPVRFALTFAFLYAAGIPLLALGITARFWLIERRQVLEDDLHRRTGRGLISFDGQFSMRLRDYADQLTQSFQELTVTDHESARTFEKKLAPVKKRLRWDFCRLVDPSGKVIYEEMRREVAGRIGGAFDYIDKGMVRIMSILRRSESDASKRGSSAGAGRAGEDTDQLFGRLLFNLGDISPIDLAHNLFFIYLYPLYDAAGECRLLILVSWTGDGMQSEFLRRELFPFSRQLESAELFAWCQDRPEDSFPRSFRHEERLGPILPRIQAKDRETRMRLGWDGETRLITGIRGSSLDAYALVAVSDDRMIRTELDAMVWGLGSGAALLLLISVMAGTLVARSFLAPISLLERGVTALAEQRFNERIPVVSSDEFGQLSTAFNHMMEGLADLEIARTVQDALFPGQALGQGTWDVYGKCVSASRIGGDYFDYFPIDEHRLAIVLGDVSGHGVSAALVMAMAKALIANSAGNIDPIRILAVLNTVFEKVLQGQKTMSCLVGILDTATDRLTIGNGGHCFPYMIRDGKAESLEVPGMLIGMGRRWRQPAAREIQLQSGDCLVGFTDALYEAPDMQTGKALGFPRLLACLPNLVGALAQDTEAAIRSWHTTVTGGAGTLDDDLTLVVIQRRSREGRQ